jgi:hypothetical protein
LTTLSDGDPEVRAVARDGASGQTAITDVTKGLVEPVVPPAAPASRSQPSVRRLTPDRPAGILD